jgi:glyoxylate reductase
MRVFITKKLPGNVEALLKKNGFDVSVHKNEKPVSRKELLKKSANTDALICLLTDKIDKEVIDNFKKCRIIANVAVGYNNIDVDYAAGKKIVVTNTPDILTDATADLAMTLLLTAARRIVEGEEMMRSGSFKGWDPNMLLGIELKNKILGIIGAGRIGKALSYRAKAFGMKIIYSDKVKNPIFEKELGARKASLNVLLKKSDFVSVHAPLNKETFHLLNKQNLKLLKRSAVLINSARGEIIDELELVKIIKAKKIFAAGLDVYENEPNINSELLKLKNVVLLPHIGSATQETRANMALLAAENVIRVLNGKKAKTPVRK